MTSNKFTFDIYPDLEFPTGYLNKFKFINIKIANPQQIMINEIVKYIKENNYYGEKYHNFREKQIEATKWWVNYFYPPSDRSLVSIVGCDWLSCALRPPPPQTHAHAGQHALLQ